MSASFPVDDDSRWRVSTATQGQTAFTVPFPFQLKTDITVWRQSVSGLIDTTLELDVDYTLTGAGNPGGGTVTLIVPAIAGEKIYRIGQASLDRTSSVVRNGKFSSEALDDDLDRSTIALQEFRRDVGRSWKVPFGEEGGVINLGAAGRALIYDENGGLSPGPNAETIEAAQSHAETAEQAASVAVGAAESAASHDQAAEESAGIAASAAQAATQAAGQVTPLAGAITTAADNIAAIEAAPQAATDAATARDLSQKFATHPEDQTILGTGGLFSSFHWYRKALAAFQGAAAAVAGAVKATVAQTFTLAEQAVARLNIGAPLRGYISGLTLNTWNAGPDNSFYVTGGECASDTAPYALMRWPDGNAERTVGGSFSGGLGTWDGGNGDNKPPSTNTTVHIFLIQRSDTGAVAILSSSSATAPVMPANYDRKRRLGSIMRNSNINRPFDQLGDDFVYRSVVGDRNGGSGALAETLLTLSVPAGVIVSPMLEIEQAHGTTAGYIATGIGPANGGASRVLVTRAANEVSSAISTRELLTNLSAQVKASITISSGTLSTHYINTRGWTDRRGKDA